MVWSQIDDWKLFFSLFDFVIEFYEQKTIQRKIIHSPFVFRKLVIFMLNDDTTSFKYYLKFYLRASTSASFCPFFNCSICIIIECENVSTERWMTQSSSTSTCCLITALCTLYTVHVLSKPCLFLITIHNAQACVSVGLTSGFFVCERIRCELIIFVLLTLI